MTPHDRRLALVACRDRASAAAPAEGPAAGPGEAGGQRGAWIVPFSARPICFPDHDEAATTRELRCTLVLFHRFAELLVSLAEGSSRCELPTELLLTAQDIRLLLDDVGTIAAAIVTRILMSLEPRLEEAIVDPSRARSAVLASPWLVFGLLDGFKALAADMLRAIVQRDRRTADLLGEDRTNQRVTRQFVDRLTTLDRAFAAAAAIPLAAEHARDPGRQPDPIARGTTARRGRPVRPEF